MTMLLVNYPLLDTFWTMLAFFGLLLWVLLVLIILSDVFRSKDLNGLSKALWVVVVLALPFVGVLLYLIFHGRGVPRWSTLIFGTTAGGTRSRCIGLALVLTVPWIILLTPEYFLSSQFATNFAEATLDFLVVGISFALLFPMAFDSQLWKQR